MVGFIANTGIAARPLARAAAAVLAITMLAVTMLAIPVPPARAQGTGGGPMMGAGQMMGGAHGMMMQGYPAGGGTDAATDGKGLYARDCAGCHGARAAGGMKFGGVTAPDLRAPGLGTMYHHDDRLLARAILLGLDEAGAPLDPVMPRWQGRLSPDQVAAIIAYLKRLHG